jgi:Tol biopolymer transport system component
MVRARRLVCLLALLQSLACAQERPRLAWIEPGAPAEYGFSRVQPDGAMTPLGQPFSWDWLVTAPSGRYAAYWRRGEAALHVRDLAMGADRLVPNLSVVDPSQIRSASWRGDTLWLLLQPSATLPPVLYAIAAAVPSAVATSGAFGIVSVTPTDDGTAAYGLARVGGAESQERILALCFADGRPPRQLSEHQRVVGGRVVESEDRVALFASRTDRAGYIVTICDRDSGQEVALNPDAGAFQPAFCRGYRKSAYTTRKGIVVQELGGEPQLVAPHLPDRRFALSYHLTPSGDALLVETPGEKAGRTRVLTRYALGSAEGPAEILRLDAPASAGGSSVTFAEDGARILVTTPLGTADGATAVHLGRVTGPLRRVADGRVLASRFAPSGSSVALVVQAAGAKDAQLQLVPADAAGPQAPPELPIALREQRGRVEAPSLSLTFAPASDRLLATAIPPGSTRPSAFLLEGTAPARLVSGDLIVRAADWSPSGDRVLVQALVGWGGVSTPVASLVGIDPATAKPTLLSGQLRVTDAVVAKDGSIVALAQLKAPARQLSISRAARESIPVSGEVDADDPIWSPDGSSVVFRSPVAQPPYSALYVGRPQTQPVLVSGELLAEDRPVWLPDGKRLYFTAVRAGDAGAVRIGCLASSGGGAPRELGPMDRVTFVTDRSALLYHSTQPTAGIYRLGLDDLANPTLVAEGYDGAVPSPDGRYAVVVREEPSGLVAGIAPLSGGAVQALPSPPYTRLSWSPDGTRLAVVSAAEGGALALVGLDGKASERLAAGVTEVAWSPTGDRLAGLCVPPEEGAASSVVCWSLDGSEVARSAWPATTVPLRDAPPTLAMLLQVPRTQLEWSPDGQAILSIGYSTDGASVTGRVLLPKTQESFPLGVPGSIADLAWAPDGTLGVLAYAESPPEGGRSQAAPRPLYVGSVTEGRFRQVRGAETVEGFAWLPDGRVAFWVTEGEPASTGTFVTNTGGEGLFRLGAAAAPPGGALWPSVEPRQRFELAWRPSRKPGEGGEGG